MGRKKVLKGSKIGFDITPAAVSLPSPHIGQRAILALPGRFKIAVCGRSFGKTVVGILACVECIEGGANRRVLWASPIREQSRRVLSEMVRWLGDGVGPAGDWTYRRAALELVHTNGGVVSFQGAEAEDSLRGPAIDLCIIDEAADITETAWKLVVLPMLLVRQGKAIFLGTPRGTSNWLHRTFMEAQSGKVNWSSYRSASAGNPAVTVEAVAVMRGEMTDAQFRQEILAEFVDSGSSVFPFSEGLDTAKLVQLGEKGDRFATGIDLGRVKDFTVVASFRTRDNNLVGFDRFNALPWAHIVGRIIAHRRLFPGVAVSDATGVGDAVYEELRKLDDKIFPFVITTDSRTNLIMACALAWEHRRFRIAPVPELVNEMRMMEWKSEESGGYTRHVPRSTVEHDDCVFALALAWFARLNFGDAPCRFDAFLPEGGLYA